MRHIKLVDKGTVGLVELLAGIVLSIGQQTKFFVHSIDSNHWVCHLGDLGGGHGRGNSSSLVATWGRGHASSQQGTYLFDGSSLEKIEIYACIIYVYIYICYTFLMHHTFHTFNLQKVLPLRSSHHSSGVVLSHRSNMAFTTRGTGEWSGWSAVSHQIKSILGSKIPHPQRVVSIPFTNQPRHVFCSTYFNAVLITTPHSPPTIPTLSKSSDAPVVILFTKSSSAALPPKATAILSKMASSAPADPRWRLGVAGRRFGQGEKWRRFRERNSVPAEVEELVGNFWVI